jgi:hypothetical protein
MLIYQDLSHILLLVTLTLTILSYWLSAHTANVSDRSAELGSLEKPLSAGDLDSESHLVYRMV